MDHSMYDFTNWLPSRAYCPIRSAAMPFFHDLRYPSDIPASDMQKFPFKLYFIVLLAPLARCPPLLKWNEFSAIRVLYLEHYKSYKQNPFFVVLTTWITAQPTWQEQSQ